MKLHLDKYVEKYIIENHYKKSLREMARELGYSDMWVKRLINKIKSEE
ncbi:hypothetical protein [Paraclostridium bifermentans]